MNHTLVFIFYLAGLICFVAAAFGRSFGRVNQIALGLALWIFPTVWTAGQNLT